MWTTILYICLEKRKLPTPLKVIWRQRVNRSVRKISKCADYANYVDFVAVSWFRTEHGFVIETIIEILRRKVFVYNSFDRTASNRPHETVVTQIDKEISSCRQNESNIHSCIHYFADSVGCCLQSRKESFSTQEPR